MTADISAGVAPIAECFETLSIPYFIGGSVASSTVGTPRLTLDIDFVADIKLEHVERFAKTLRGRYYVSESMIQDAIRRKSCFNLIDLSSILKIDIFVSKQRDFDRSVFSRITLRSIGTNDGPKYWMTSAEDILLSKLEWFELGNRLSERQWGDIKGILTTQKERIDRDYLRKWAAKLSLSELLEEVLREADDLPLPPRQT